MAYTQVRYIGYQVSTVGLANPTVYGIAPGVVNNPPPLAGVTGNLSADAQVRVERLIGALLRAHARVQTNDNVQTLKVFVAPEFYFRPNNPDTSYSMNEYRAIKAALRATVADVPQNRFKDWLIVPGTIMWKMTANESYGNRTITDPNREVYFNTTLYIKPSNNPTVTSSKVIEKTTASGIDGIPTGRHGGNFPVDLNMRSASEEFPKYQDMVHKIKHAFRLGGLNFGLEICLEHGLHVLKTVLRDQRRGFGRYDQIHLHLLTAGGMDYIPTSVAARINGFILRNDGYVDESAGDRAIEMLQVTAYDSRRGASHVGSTATLDDIETNYTPTSIPIAATDDLYLPPPPSCAGTWTTQRIVVYPSLPLP